MITRQTISRVLTGMMLGFVLGVVLHQSSKVDVGVQRSNVVMGQVTSSFPMPPMCDANPCSTNPCPAGQMCTPTFIYPSCKTCIPMPSSMGSGCDPAQTCAAMPCPTGEFCTDTAPAGPPSCHTCTPMPSSAGPTYGCVAGCCTPMAGGTTDPTCGGTCGSGCGGGSASGGPSSGAPSSGGASSGGASSGGMCCTSAFGSCVPI